jgi:2-C-methyl-D-erythritol 4-phosphate cytidylyltransferase / 2-C-methyl-D-erythritol 2,4-cyclodiphosphate synthase
VTSARIATIVVAAGSGTRLGRPEPKAFVRVGGVSILARALAPIFALPEPVQVVVVAPAAQVEEARAIARDVAGAAHASVSVVAGGDTRQLSVTAGLALVEPGVEVVLVHDAARAFTPTSQFAAVIAAVRRNGGGVVPALPVADTVKRVDWRGTVEETVDRSELVTVQTPQGFPADGLRAAYAAGGDDHTDDAALFSAHGGTVVTIDGDPLAFKITTPWDLRRAEMFLDEKPIAAPRTGVGVDVHAFDDSQPLWLGGVYWPDEPGLAGHSDGDAVSHAICDALLSAAGLGDLGSRFGTSDPRFANARGEVFIAKTVALVAGAGFTIANVAVQVIGNRPRVSGRRAEVESVLTALVGAPVSVSATTSDHLGFTGRGEGITALATAMLLA